MGIEITKQDLGDERSQVFEAGVIDNLAETEDEAFEMIRRFLSYMPSSVWELPTRVPTGDDPQRRDERLLSIIPRDKKRPYDAHEILNAVLDRNSFFEIAPHYGRSRIVGLARMDGYAVGVMTNNPKFLGGSMDVAAGNKVVRFIQLCDTFHLPMVYFADEPGFMVGPEQQELGILRAGARMLTTTLRTQVPWISILTRQLYGVAGQCHDRPTGMFRRVAWPSGHWGSMHISGGVSAAYRRIIDESDDPEATRMEIEERLEALASPFRTAEAFNVEKNHRSPRHPAAGLRLHQDGSTDVENPARPLPVALRPLTRCDPSDRAKSSQGQTEESVADAEFVFPFAKRGVVSLDQIIDLLYGDAQWWRNPRW